MSAPIFSCIVAVAALSGVNPRQAPRDLVASVDTLASQARDAAAKGLETLRKLVNERNYRVMGFDSLGEVRSATLGAPLVRFYVRLDQLRTYQPGTDASGLLSGGDRVTYSVLVGREVRTSIVLDKSARGWTPVSYGGPNSTKLLYGILAQSSRGATSPGTHYFILDVLALGLHFLGVSQQGRLLLVPLLDDQQGRWKAGVALPADKILGLLVAEAKAYNGLPR